MLIEGGCSRQPAFNRRGCSRQPVFSRRGLLIKGVFQVGQFSACSGHDRFVKFNRRGGANKQRGGGKIILKLIDGGARLLETPE